MSEREADPQQNRNISIGALRFFSLPADVRNKFIQECIQRWEQDKAYFQTEGKTIDDFEEGTVLPSGNKIVVDEKGIKIFQTPPPLPLQN